MKFVPPCSFFPKLWWYFVGFAAQASALKRRRNFREHPQPPESLASILDQPSRRVLVEAALQCWEVHFLPGAGLEAQCPQAAD